MYKVKTTNGIYAIKHLNPQVMKRKDTDSYIEPLEVSKF